jgi:hypothetical protein
MNTTIRMSGLTHDPFTGSLLANRFTGSLLANSDSSLAAASIRVPDSQGTRTRGVRGRPVQTTGVADSQARVSPLPGDGLAWPPRRRGTRIVEPAMPILVPGRGLAYGLSAPSRANDGNRPARSASRLPRDRSTTEVAPGSVHGFKVAAAGTHYARVFAPPKAPRQGARGPHGLWQWSRAPEWQQQPARPQAPQSSVTRSLSQATGDNSRRLPHTTCQPAS